MDPSLARSLLSTLANPYALSNSHQSRQHVNHQGYTFSSTYNPSSHPSISYTSLTPSFSNLPSPSASRNPLPHRSAPPTHWYSPGNKKCTYSGCTFTGSANSVQTHMMDRHLIYPPEWHARKRQPDWDADPSLKGKPIPILGTNVRLDTPEDVAAWIAERKRRWPMAVRVAEKKRRLEEAIASGGLHPDHLALMGGGKRFRPVSPGAEVARGRRGRGGGGGFSRGRGRGRVHGRGAARGGITSSGRDLPSSRTPIVNDTEPPRPPSVPSAPPTRDAALRRDSDDDDDDDDAAPEVVSAKRPPGIETYGSSSDAEVEAPKAVKSDSHPGPTIPSSLRGGPAAASDIQQPTVAKAEPINCSRRAPPPQPKKTPRNPFAARSPLLRNLLLPEIRMTVSNLSQAIHFLVENDFLENVELKPGEANEKRIEVVGEQAVSPESETGLLEHT